MGFKLDQDFSQMHLWYESPTLGSCRVVAFTRFLEKMDLSVTFRLLHLWYHCVLLLWDNAKHAHCIVQMNRQLCKNGTVSDYTDLWW